MVTSAYTSVLLLCIEDRDHTGWSHSNLTAVPSALEVALAADKGGGAESAGALSALSCCCLRPRNREPQRVALPGSSVSVRDNGTPRDALQIWHRALSTQQVRETEEVGAVVSLLSYFLSSIIYFCKESRVALKQQ